MTAIGTFLALVFVRDWAFWRYALSERGVVTGASVGTLWAHAAVPIGLTVVLAAMALACGSAILRWGQSPRSGRVRVLEGTELPLAFALGAGLFAAAVALLGAARRLDGPHLGMLLAAITSVTATQAGLLRGRRPSLGLRPGWIGVLQGLLAYSAWHTLILALAPPTEWDVLAYHLPIPKLYLSWGAIREIPWLLHSHWPHLMEAFYALPLAFREDGAAALWHGACCWALVAATWAAAREELDEKVAWIAAAAVAAQPTFLRIAGTAHSDGAMALFLFLAGWCLWRFDGSRERRWLWLGAAFSGLGASCKLFGAAPAIAWTMWLALRSRRDAALFAAASLAIVAPWYAKAWLGAGNPVWPFFSSVFGGAWGASLLEKPYLVSTRWPWPPDWELLIRYGPQWLLGPLAFLALASGRARPPRFVLFSLLPALALFPVVLRQQEAWRFLLPLFPALGMLLGWWALKARSWAAAAAVAIALAPAALARQGNELFPVSGVRSKLAADRDPRELYLERSLDHYRPYEYIRRSIPADSRVLLYREVRSYWLGLDYRWGDPLNQAVIPYAALSSPEELRAALAREGITHVLVNDELAMYGPSQRYYDERALALMDGVLKRHADPPGKFGPISLYRLR